MIREFRFSYNEFINGFKIRGLKLWHEVIIGNLLFNIKFTEFGY